MTFDWSSISEKRAAELVAELEPLDSFQRYNKFQLFTPHPKQMEFFALGGACWERMLRAGGQLGKSDAGAFEVAIHMTGLYPDWWTGHRFNRATRGWVCGESLVATRDIQQKKLCGSPGVSEEFGTGFIPKHLFVSQPSASHGGGGAFDTMAVRHVSGGVSTATYKTYEQGRLKHQGEPIDWIWDDEEPPMDIYGEHVARRAATQGIILVTYTPLQGRTKLVSRFDREVAPGRGLVKVSIWDCLGYLPHLMTKEQVEAVIATYEEYTRQARAYGDPVLGEGAIFTLPEEQFKFAYDELPGDVKARLFLLWGIDFGISHPFAAVLIGWDKDDDVIYVLNGFRIEGATKFLHIPRMLAICADAPVAWPHDGHDRDKGSGEELAGQYKRPGPDVPGVKMLPDHAQFEEGGYSTEAGITLLQDLENFGQIKYARHLNEFFEERRDYHREKGLIVKKNDDMISALRTAVMQRRSAKLAKLGRSGRSTYRMPQEEQKVTGWDIFTGQPTFGG